MVLTLGAHQTPITEAWEADSACDFASTLAESFQSGQSLLPDMHCDYSQYSALTCLRLGKEFLTQERAWK
jgi:hypothetical protein